MPRRRDRPVWRALLLTGAIVVTVGVSGGGAPAIAASAGEGEDTPTPTEPASPEPSPTETATPEPTPTPTPSPAEPAEPTPPDNSPDPWTAVPPDGAAAPPPTSGESLPVGAAPAAPAAFGRVYPTNPWIYNAQPGTRYLDVRERAGSRVVRQHMGIDSQGRIRQPIFAVAAGTVADGTWGTTRRDGHGFGNQVLISHPDGYATRYAHLADAPLVQPGDQVTTGQLIGYMGGSQRGDLMALERHLHFEVTHDGRHIDPLEFLTGASVVAAALSAPVGATATTDSLLYEIKPRGDGSYESTATGVAVNSRVYSAVAMGGDSAQVMVSEDGRLKQLAVENGAWTNTDTGISLDATSLSAVDTGSGFPEVLAVEEGKLFHIVGSDAGWTKTWTGHHLSGTVSAVRLPGDRLHAMLEQSGYLYHLSPAEGGLWNVTDTGLEVGEQVDAVYVGGDAPEAMTVFGGELHRIIWDGLTWHTQSTGLSASGSLAAVYQDGGWPSVINAESDEIGLMRVADRLWTRYAYSVTAPGPIDAVVIGGTAVLYSIG